VAGKKSTSLKIGKYGKNIGKALENMGKSPINGGF
jgi:hypothetical protein